MGREGARNERVVELFFCCLEKELCNFSGDREYNYIIEMRTKSKFVLVAEAVDTHTFLLDELRTALFSIRS